MSQGLLNTVGRGYTDLTAALVAASLQAKELQIWKDVDGIFTADPNKLPGARLVPQITPEEAAELTFFGSVVIHPVAMQQAVRKQIPIRIKNVQDSKKNGTVVKADVGTRGAATAATIKEDVWVVNVQSNQQRVGHHFYSQVFQVLDAAKVDVDLISTSEVNVSMAISGYSRIPLHLLEAVGQVQVHKNMAIVSVVGQGMRSSIGLSARMLGSLSRAGINIEMISQGASEINISCVVDGRRAVDALKAVHKELLSS